MQYQIKTLPSVVSNKSSGIYIAGHRLCLPKYSGLLHEQKQTGPTAWTFIK